MKKTGKKYLFLVFFLVINLSNSFSQDFFDEFESLIEIEKPVLLPEKMIFTQRILWGEKGLFRKTGISNLTVENREKELIVREKMLKAHQIIGYITFAGMIYQGILGGKLYNGDKYADSDLLDLINSITSYDSINFKNLQYIFPYSNLLD